MQKPETTELAKRESSIYLTASTFTRLMTPDDTVLQAKASGDYRIYRETLRDDQCASTFAQRRLAVISREWTVDPASEDPLDVAAADAVRENLAALDFDRITERLLYARWYGHAIGECMWSVRDGRIWLDDIRVRDRARFAYDLDDQLYLQTLAGQYELMPDRKFVRIETGADHDDSPYGLGLAHYCYWPVFFKRSGLKFWLVFCEKFGSPTASGKAPASMLNDEATRLACLAALDAIASETSVLIPEGMEVSLIEATRPGTGTYKELCEAMDAALAKIVIGQTASSQGTPGRLGNDNLQADVRIDLVKADADLVCAALNRQAVAWLTAWNFPNARPPRVWRIVEPPEDLTARAERDTKIYALGYEPTEAYITETYGPGWQKKAQQQGLDPQQLQQGLAAQFAELGGLAAMKLGHRGDQAALAEAAALFAAKYQDVIGERVQDLVAYAEASGDYETFAKRLREMMAEAPPTQTQQAVERGNFFARLLGAMRAQR